MFVVILKYFVLVTAVTNELLETESNVSHTTQEILPGIDLYNGHHEFCVFAGVF